MPIVEELNARQIAVCLDEAIARQLPVAMSCCIGGHWHNLHTCLLHCTGDSLWLTCPADSLTPAVMIGPGVQAGLAFKLRHHKHIFSAGVRALGQFGLAGQPVVQALQVPLPERMQRIQRRAYFRADVPRNRSVLATFWEGPEGPEGSSPAGSGPSAGVLGWEGWVENISAGGFQVRLASPLLPDVEIGDVVRVRIELGQEFPLVQAQAQLRHQVSEQPGVVSQGFQFIGLNDSEQGRRTLARVSTIVCHFQRLSEHRPCEKAG